MLQRLAVEDPHVGAPDARRRELRIKRDVLPAVGRRDEGAAPAGAREDDIARLVPDMKGADDAPRARTSAELDDAYAV